MKFLNIIIIILICWKINIVMALEEPEYKLIQSSYNYEIRKYDNRLAVEVEYSNSRAMSESEGYFIPSLSLSPLMYQSLASE